MEIHPWADKIEGEVKGLLHEDLFYDRSVLHNVEGVSWQSCLCPIPEKIP